MIYQVRSLNGQKILEREDPEEVRHWLRKRPALNDCQVWILRDYPGGLEGVLSAKDFTLKQKHKKPIL